MDKYQYVKDFEKMGFGMFVHFGLYSVNAKGEWSYHLHKLPEKKYDKLIPKFKVTKNWAKNLVKTAKSTGCKYITLTTRHHDGFSLYDTKGLSDYGVMNSPTKRDLIKEFVDECNANGIVPFFYHTLLDWRNEYYKTDAAPGDNNAANIAEVIIAKNRHGSTGTVKMGWIGQYTKFRTIADNIEE